MILPMLQTVAFLAHRVETDRRKRVAPALVEELKSLGPSAVAPLIRIAMGEWREWAGSDHRQLQLQAMTLIQELRPPEAIRPLFDLLIARPRDKDYDEVTFDDTIQQALASFGAAVLEPGLEAYARAPDQSTRVSVYSILSGLGVHDDRVRAILLHHLDFEPEWAAMMFGRYGDPSTLEHLIARLDRYEVTEPLTGNCIDAVTDSASAIVALGGKLTAAQRDKLYVVEGPERKLDVLRRQLRRMLGSP